MYNTASAEPCASELRTLRPELRALHECCALYGQCRALYGQCRALYGQWRALSGQWRALYRRESCGIQGPDVRTVLSTVLRALRPLRRSIQWPEELRLAARVQYCLAHTFLPRIERSSTGVPHLWPLVLLAALAVERPALAAERAALALERAALASEHAALVRARGTAAERGKGRRAPHWPQALWTSMRLPNASAALQQTRGLHNAADFVPTFYSSACVFVYRFAFSQTKA
jgi:hypothetical protein